VHRVYIQTDRLADKQTDGGNVRTDRHTDRQRYRQADRLTDRQKHRNTDRQAGRQTERQRDRQKERITDWQAGTPTETQIYRQTDRRVDTVRKIKRKLEVGRIGARLTDRRMCVPVGTHTVQNYPYLFAESIKRSNRNLPVNK
jgi:hypothetical protein